MNLNKVPEKHCMVSCCMGGYDPLQYTLVICQYFPYTIDKCRTLWGEREQAAVTNC